MDKKGRADVGVGIGSRVVEIDVQSTIFARIVPIAADNRQEASNDALSFLISLKRGEDSPLLLTFVRNSPYSRYAASGLQDRAAPMLALGAEAAALRLTHKAPAMPA